MTKPSKMKSRRKAPTRRGKTTSKAAAEMSGGIHRKTTSKVAAKKTIAAKAGPAMFSPQFQAFRHNQVPDSMRALTESGVAQTRELYERSKNAVYAVLESWHKSFGAAGQGAVAVNRKVFDIAERNISSSFDFAKDLAGAKNFAEAIELQTTYWREQLGQWKAQAEEMRALSTKITSNIAEPVKAQVTRLQKVD
jgi:phasin